MVSEKVSLGKKLMLQELEKEFSSNENAFFSRLDRLNVQEINELRRGLEKISKRTVMVKHTLAKKVLEKIQLSEAVSFLEGSVLVTFGAEEPQQVSKTLVAFVRGHENLKLAGLILEGKVYEGNFIKELAQLPSRKELLTLAAIRLKSPLTRLAMTLRGFTQSLVMVLNEIHKKRAQQAPEKGRGPLGAFRPQA